MTILSQASEAFHYWKTNLPKDLFFKSTSSCYIATFIATCVTKSAKIGVASGTLSGLASLIHGFTSPFFRTLLNRTQLTRKEEFLRGSIGLIGAGYVAKSLGAVTTVWESTFWAGIVVHGIGICLEKAYVFRNLDKASFLIFLHPALAKYF